VLFSSSEIQRLYEAEDYPLGKPEWPSAAREFAKSAMGPCFSGVHGHRPQTPELRKNLKGRRLRRYNTPTLFAGKAGLECA
jgi:hypothetical protein